MIIMRAGKRSRGSGLPETSTTVDPSKAGPVLGGSLHARMNASCSCRRMRSVCFLMAFYIHSRAFARGGCFLLMLTNPAVRLFYCAAGSVMGITDDASKVSSISVTLLRPAVFDL